MFYRGYLTPVTCPLCGTLNNQVRTECRFCGTSLENQCSECGEYSDPSARFCKCCGKPTVYKLSNVFDEDYHSHMTNMAADFYSIHGDPDSPKEKMRRAKNAQELRQQYPEIFGNTKDDYPEPPLEDDYIPWY